MKGSRITVMSFAGSKGVIKLTWKLKLAIETILEVADGSRYGEFSRFVTMLMYASSTNLTAESLCLLY
jgi:hypothetical protein